MPTRVPLPIWEHGTIRNMNPVAILQGKLPNMNTVTITYLCWRNFYRPAKRIVFDGVGWGNNVHWHLHTYVMLRHCTFFFNCHTYVMLRHCTFFFNCHTYVMLRHCTFFFNCDIHQATVLIRLWASSRRKNAERVVDRKVKPSSSETPFFQSKLMFRYGETMN